MKHTEMTLQVDPNDMVQYVQTLLTAPRAAKGRPDMNTPVARAAQLRWGALNRAFGDVRVHSWMSPRKRDQIQVPAALIAAAGVARLTMENDEVVFDIPTLLDATLQFCEPVGHA
ncbi:MAG TPA: hypothetical protein VHY75_12600 [Steroidobacteraceae bacterium]|jgi:hypothetical protein|nr:hypothetical protein [Steroidobacteraceae bacterium]